MPYFHYWCLVCSQFCWKECTHGSCCGLWTGWRRVASSVSTLELWSWNPSGDDIWLATSGICLFLSSRVAWLVWLAESLCLLSSLWWLTGVSGVRCQTTSGISDNPVVLTVSGRSYAVPEGIRGILTLKLGPQPGYFQLYCFVWLVVDFDFVPSSFYCEEVVCLLHWLQKIIFLWSGSFCHRSHRVGRHFMVFSYFGCLHCWHWQYWRFCCCGC